MANRTRTAEIVNAGHDGTAWSATCGRGFLPHLYCPSIRFMLVEARQVTGGITVSENETRLREALATIAQVASAAVNGGDDYSGHEHDDDEPAEHSPQSKQTCTPKSLPARLIVAAAQTAVKI